MFIRKWMLMQVPAEGVEEFTPLNHYYFFRMNAKRHLKNLNEVAENLEAKYRYILIDRMHDEY